MPREEDSTTAGESSHRNDVLRRESSHVNDTAGYDTSVPPNETPATQDVAESSKKKKSNQSKASQALRKLMRDLANVEICDARKAWWFIESRGVDFTRPHQT